jgi:hypothetical protein
MAEDPSDPLERARAELARLKDASDWDEPTGKTEVNVTVRMPSQPEIDQPAPTRPQNDPPEPQSLPAPVKAAVAVMDRLPPTHRWIVVVLAAAVAAVAGRQLGWW